MTQTNREMVRGVLDNGSLSLQEIEDVLVQLVDSVAMTSKPQALIAGYTSQPDAKVALVNEFKADEERLLRKLDGLQQMRDAVLLSSYPTGTVTDEQKSVMAKALADSPDKRWLDIARTHFQEGFMALNRAVFQPQRIELPEDAE